MDDVAETLHALVASELHPSLHPGRRGKRWIDELCSFCLHGFGRR